MRVCLNALVLAGLAGTVMLEAGAGAVAADLTVVPQKRKTVQHRATVVADYDGTPIVLRRTRPVVIHDAHGAAVVRHGLYAAHWVPRGIPSHYFNGQRIR